MRANYRLKDGRAGIVLAFSALAALFCVGDYLLSFAFLLAYPVLIALFAVVFCFDKSAFKLCSVLTAAISIGLCFFLSYELLLFKTCAILCGFLICLCLKCGVGKAETSLYLVLALFAAVVTYLYITIGKRCGSFNPVAVREAYFGLLSELRTYLCRYYSEMQSLLIENGRLGYAPLGYDEINLAVNNLFCLIVSLLFIVLFIFIGITLKIFRAMAIWLTVPSLKLYIWRFKLKPMYAYFYFFLMFCSYFISTESLLDIGVLNLYTFFSFVFAYIGLSFIYALLSDKHGRVVSAIIIFIGFLLISSFALNLVSALGAIITVFISKFKIKPVNITVRKDGNGED